jgi:hypothetical protein
MVTDEVAGLVGSGVAVGDIDGDEVMDILRVTIDGLKMWSATPTGWELTTWFEDVYLPRSAAVSLADFDADGDLDVFLAGYGTVNMLLRNDGGGVFVDVAAQVGLERFPYQTLSSAWGDIDLDGDLDLIVGNYAEVPPRDESAKDPSRLYLNAGKGRNFTDVSHWLPEERVQGAFTFMHALVDTNLDGYPEIVSVTDFFYVEPSAILVNAAGTGFEVDEYNNFQLGFNGMGIGVGDSNADSIPDFVQSSTGRLSMMVSSPSAAMSSGALWFEFAGARGLSPNSDRGHTFGWGTEYADFDNDGDLDVPMCWGYWEDFPMTGPLADPKWALDALWLEGEFGVMTDVAEEWGYDDSGSSRGLVVTDINGDGWLDSVKGIVNGPTTVHMATCGTQSWLGVELTDSSASNPDAIGARIEVTAGDETWVRWIFAGSTSMFSGGPPNAHFGLVDIETLDEVKVIWPDQTVSTFNDVSTKQNLHIRRNY